MKARIVLKSFPGHLGIPGHQGGSLPMAADKGGGEGGQSDIDDADIISTPQAKPVYTIWGDATERKLYVASQKQLDKWDALEKSAVPSDDEFKTRWTKSHHGKTQGWGIGKRDWMLGNLKYSKAYQIGIWQGRVDKARNIAYSEERNSNSYNLGYYRGYDNYQSDRQGWDTTQRAQFDELYVKDAPTMLNNT